MQDLTAFKNFLAALIHPIVSEAVKASITSHQSKTNPLFEKDEPLSPDEAAAFLKTSKVSLWSWERKGLIRGYHLGNKKYFLRNELLASLTSKGGAA
jgi:hypothetical protein